MYVVAVLEGMHLFEMVRDAIYENKLSEESLRRMSANTSGSLEEMDVELFVKQIFSEVCSEGSSCDLVRAQQMRTLVMDGLDKLWLYVECTLQKRGVVTSLDRLLDVLIETPHLLSVNAVAMRQATLRSILPTRLQVRCSTGEFIKTPKHAYAHKSHTSHENTPLMQSHAYGGAAMREHAFGFEVVSRDLVNEVIFVSTVRDELKTLTKSLNEKYVNDQKPDTEQDSSESSWARPHLDDNGNANTSQWSKIQISDLLTADHPDLFAVSLTQTLQREVNFSRIEHALASVIEWLQPGDSSVKEIRQQHVHSQGLNARAIELLKVVTKAYPGDSMKRLSQTPALERLKVIVEMLWTLVHVYVEGYPPGGSYVLENALDVMVGLRKNAFSSALDFMSDMLACATVCCPTD
eukprot:SAG11_NODE_34_length_22265_cov_11.264730_21_plen_407_part_00